MSVSCPRCGFEQPGGEDCAKCGVNFKRYVQVQKRKARSEEGTSGRPSSGVGRFQKEQPEAQARGRVAWPIKRSVVRDICTSLGQLLSSGTGPVMSFQMLAGSARPAVREQLELVAARVEAGGTLAEAMLAAPRLFRSGDAAVVAAFDMAGEPGQGFAAVAANADEAIKARRQLIKNLAYPLFVLVMWILISPVPKLILSGQGAYLRSVGTRGGILIFALVAIFWLLPALLRATPLGDKMKRLCWRLPWPATVWVHHARATFHRALARNLSAGLELFTAVRSAAAATTDPEVVARAERVLERAPSIGLAQPVGQEGLVAHAELVLVVSGEKSGELPQTLTLLSDRYSEARRRGLRNVVAASGTLLFLGVAVVTALSIIDAYRGVAQTAEMLMDGINGPIKDMSELQRSLGEGLGAGGELNLEGLDLNGLDLEGLNLQNLDMEGVGLPGTNFDGSALRDLEPR